MIETLHVLPDRLDHVADVLTAAFADDPVMAWIFGDLGERPDSLRAFMALASRRSHSMGHAYEVAGESGAALWGPPGVHFFDEAAGAELYEIVTGANGPRSDLVFSGLSGLAEHHPDEPHFYLNSIGVAPESQGKGLGARLLERVLATCDREGVTAYLESSNPRNVSLYERAGFSVTAEIQLPEGPVMRPMTRPPRPRQLDSRSGSVISS